jgi:hypothetical protein
VVAVGPFRREGIRADEVEIDEPDLLVGQRRPRVEPAGEARLAAAEGARTEPPQGRGGEHALVAVLPLQLQRPGAAIQVDPDRDNRARGGVDGRGPAAVGWYVHDSIVQHRRLAIGRSGSA